MPLYADLQSQGYLDPQYGTVSNNKFQPGEKGFNCDNPSLFSSQAMLLSGVNLWPSYVRFFLNCQTTAGFMHRYPGNSGEISVDELIGAATLSELAANLMLIYGREHWWVFQPQGGPFVWSAFMGRYLNFIPYVKHRAEGLKWYDLAYKILWSICCVLSAMPEPGNTSGKLLMWVQIERMKGRYFICDMAIRFWKWRMNRQYVRGMKTVFGIFFGQSHTFYAYAPERA